MAAHPSTVYRLDDTGEVHEVAVDDLDAASLDLGGIPVAPMWPRVEQGHNWARATWDEISWWARQLGRPLNAS